MTLTIHETLDRGFTRLSESEYHAHPALSSGIAKTMLNKSPLHARHVQLNPRDEANRTLDIGSLFHGMVLERGATPVLYPDTAYKKNGDLNPAPAAEFRDSLAEDQIAVKPADMEALNGMVKSAQEALASIGIVIDSAQSEQQAYTEIDGCPVRAMYDFIPADHRLPIIDLKKTQDASPRGIQKAMTNYGYDFQREWYGDVYRAMTGADREFLFLFVEEEAPHAAAFATPDWTTREVNAQRCKHARATWKECLETGVWPGYDGRVMQYQMPPWQVTAILEGME